MVDATTSIRRDQAGDEAPRVTVTPVTEERIAVYAELASSPLTAPAQSAEWIRAWIANTASDCLIVTIDSAGRPMLALAMEVTKASAVRALRFMGGKHANGNFPVVNCERAAALTTALLTGLPNAIRRARPDIDFIHFERMAPEIGGLRNPLLSFPHARSPNIALAVDLTGGFDAALERASGRRKRKKHRSQMRKFEASGGYRRVEARSPEEVVRLLRAFFEMKEQRFRKMGITDVFGDDGTRRFLLDAFTSSLGVSPRFVLNGLEVGGTLRAVTGSSVCGDRMICEFGAIAEDELAHASPGDFLFFENIREAAENGFALYDFSVGDEPYKRLWCDTELIQFDVTIPLTVKGRLHAAALRLGGGAKRHLKEHRALWALLKRLRRYRRMPATADG